MSEWQRSARNEPVLTGEVSAGHRNRKHISVIGLALLLPQDFDCLGSSQIISRFLAHRNTSGVTIAGMLFAICTHPFINHKNKLLP